MRKPAVAMIGAVLLGTLVATPALAERDPAYAAARAAGRVGEQPDGYIGIVGKADLALQRVVDSINIRRRELYAQKAQINKATIEAYALTSGCQAILRTVPGEKYRTPEGLWKTRTEEPPLRDPRCP